MEERILHIITKEAEIHLMEQSNCFCTKVSDGHQVTLIHIQHAGGAV